MTCHTCTQTKGEPLNELALFAGAGGGILGGMLLGWRTVAAVEIEEYPRAVLLQRQSDGILPRFPVWDDVRTFDGRPWRGKVDVVTGGFPCQDISAAGKGAGITGSRSGLWTEMARIIGEVRPRYVFVENSPMLVSRGLTTVLADLAEMGYDARWGIVGAHHAGGFHKRDRIFILADSELLRRHTWHTRNTRRQVGAWSEYRLESHRRPGLYPTPRVCRVANGVACRNDRLKCIGNGQVPAVAALAWEVLTNA